MIVGLREFHSFEAAGRRYLYLVPSAAVFALDEIVVNTWTHDPAARHRSYELIASAAFGE